MTRRNKNQQKNGLASAAARVTSLEKKVLAMSTTKQEKKKKPTPFGSTGSIVGGALGGMFGNSKLGSGIGRWLGTGIGSIFGSGDYQMAGPSAKYNVLTNGSQIPKFSSGAQTNVVCHREYLGDITGTSAFNNTLYPLNPGMSNTFPWLSTVAQNYQEYKFHGLIFEFRPLITDFVTNGAPGVVVMSTNYNSDSVAYTSKQQMENAEYAVSVKPTTGLMHGIECAASLTPVSQLFVREAAVPTGQDLRLYDHGLFQFATQANPIQDLGELWVSYCVEFFKPVLGTVSGELATTHIVRSSASSSGPLGTIGISNVGTLGASATSQQIIWNGVPGFRYLITVAWNGGNNTVAAPTFSISGGSFVASWNNEANSSVQSPSPTTTSTSLTFNTVILAGAGGSVTLTAAAGGAYPSTNYVDIYVATMDASVTG
jgi:hypothetical protein